MNNYGLFMQFGIRAAGGPAFLKRTREAVGQLQTRTSVAALVNQLETRTRSVSTTATAVFDYSCYDYSGNYGWFGPNNGSSPTCNTSLCNSNTWLCEDISFLYGYCLPNSYWACYWWDCRCSTTVGAWSAWSATTSCTTQYTSGYVTRECRTVQVCQFGEFSEWSDTATCTVSTPACSAGATKVECQTVYNWGEWSAYEEVDVCTSQSPALGAGAVEIECVPQ